MAGPSWAKVLERTIGVITAPWIGSGSCPAWMQSVSIDHARSSCLPACRLFESLESLMPRRLARPRSLARPVARIEREAGEKRVGHRRSEELGRERSPGMGGVQGTC